MRRLVEGGARFVLIGGLAVNAWGVVRGTKDVDIVPDPDPDNLRRIAEVAVGADGHVQTREMIAGSAFSIAALMASGERVLIETSLGPLDVVQGLPGVLDYDELRDRAVDDVYGGFVDRAGTDERATLGGRSGRAAGLPGGGTAVIASAGRCAVVLVAGPDEAATRALAADLTVG